MRSGESNSHGGGASGYVRGIWGRDADPEQAYLAELESSDIYLGLLGRRYGKPLRSKFSATHTEYLHAEKHGLRMAIWALSATDREGHEQAFLDEVRTFYVAPEFRSVPDLEAQIQERLTALTAIGAEDLAPWCKLRNIIFRAVEITDRGNEIEVNARVRNNEVAHKLEHLRPDRLSHGEEGRFTWQGRSKQVRVRSVETTTTSARSILIRIGLDVIQAPQNSMIEISLSGMGPDELTASALRTALFGERNPLLREHLGFFAEIADPFESLREHPVSEETVRPIAELMLTDELVGSGRAERIASFKLGVDIRGRRKCEVERQTPRRFSNDRDKMRKIDGSVPL